MCGRTMKNTLNAKGEGNGSSRHGEMGPRAVRSASAVDRIRTCKNTRTLSGLIHDRGWANKCHALGGRDRPHQRDGAGLGAYVQSCWSRSVVLSPNGRTSPLFTQEQVEQLVATVKETEPAAHDLPGYSWSLKKVRRWVKQVFRCTVSRSALRILLKQNGLSWKKCQKVLKKASPEKRAAFIEAFQKIFAQVCQEEMRLIYIDESHFHRDMDLGYTWATTGKPAWRLSDCPPLSERINWYGAYDFSQAQCFIWNEGSCNKEHTVKFLHHLAEWLRPLSSPVMIIWDGAPWHRAKLVQQAAADLGFILHPLPGYSPDLNPIEGLWKWMRQEVTFNHCHLTMRQLFDACKAFIERLNAAPDQILSRLWPKFQLDPDFEKLLLSN